MVMFMSASGKVIKQMGMENINIKMVHDMRAYGKTTCSMEMELKLGQMEAYIKERMKKVKNKEKGILIYIFLNLLENTLGPMDLYITGIGSIIKYVDLGCTHGLTAEAMRVSGQIII